MLNRNERKEILQKTVGANLAVIQGMLYLRRAKRLEQRRQVALHLYIGRKLPDRHQGQRNSEYR